MTNPTGTPRSLGFAMPAEWHRHSRCWMAWPCREALWGSGLEAARSAYVEVARTIAEFEPVTMICNAADVAEASLATGSGVEVLSLPINDSWLRDNGPTFLLDAGGRLGAIHWGFNGYGDKYQDYAEDAAVAATIATRTGARVFDAGFVLEGGAINVDGEGTALATESCVLNPNRNADVTRKAIEARLSDLLGVDKVIWLPRGYEDDETDGHIDNIACFARPGVVLALSTDDSGDANHPVLRENLGILRTETDAKGRRLEVIEVPQPARRMGPDGRRLPLSYINFHMANGGVVMPSFRSPEDDRAFRILRETFPDRKVRRVQAADIVVGGGGIHCITQQQPAA